MTPIDAHGIQRVTHRVPTIPTTPLPGSCLREANTCPPDGNQWNELADATTGMDPEGPSLGQQSAPTLPTRGPSFLPLPVPQFPPLPMRPEAVWDVVLGMVTGPVHVAARMGPAEPAGEQPTQPAAQDTSTDLSSWGTKSGVAGDVGVSGVGAMGRKGDCYEGKAGWRGWCCGGQLPARTRRKEEMRWPPTGNVGTSLRDTGRKSIGRSWVKMP